MTDGDVPFEGSEEHEKPCESTKGTKGSKGFEEEKYWYPEYGLKKNPFAVRDASVEFEADEEIFFVENKAVIEVKSIVDAQESALIIGPWGSGKTKTAQTIAFEYERTILVPGLRKIGDAAAHILYERFKSELQKNKESTMWNIIGEGSIYYINSGVEARIKRRKPLRRDSPPLGTLYLKTYDKPEYYPVRENDLFCSGCKERCGLDPIRSTDPEETASGVDVVDLTAAIAQRLKFKLMSREPCPMFNEAVKWTEFKGWKICIDSPNEVTPEFVRDLGNLCLTMESKGAQILLFGTHEQIAIAKKHSDKFRKWRILELPLPEPEFWIKLADGRLRGKDRNAVFTDGAIHLLSFKAHHNAREFLKFCSEALIKARGEHRKEPIDEAYASAGGLRTGPISHEEAVDEAVRRLKEKGVSIAKNRDLVSEFQALGIEVNPARLGRLMKSKGYVKRYNPDAEYFLN